ncbi:MAG TPA: serine/threonine-protein kinase [Fibrobacteria bacterium]|nr:serine/threonine-protein kinase [Fibrobacteria bacterium]
MIPRLPKGFSHPMTIGEGSFSSVYRARQRILDRWVAVKILHEKNGARRVELLNEARNQAQMSISCIPGVYDAFIKGQQLFIVMEWIKGSSLQALLEHGIPDPADRSALSSSIIAALAGLHQLGYAHRDIKPANILVTPDADVYLVDFGFSKKVGEGGQSMIGAIKGTPAYMAPEMWRGEGNIDFMRADLFALGKVLRELAPGPEWESVIAALSASDPKARPGSAAKVREQCLPLFQTRISPEWKTSIGQATSRQFSQRLLQAAKQLLFAKRGEEAYWLLAECLSEDPDCAEAFRLIDNYKGRSKGKRRSRWLMAAAAAFAFLLSVSAAFVIGKRLERVGRFPAITADADAGILLLPAHGRGKKSPGKPGKFREPGGIGGKLAGVLFLEGADACDTISLDAHGLLAPLPSGGLPLEPGEHSLSCLDGMGDILYREKIALLPFQRKILRIRLQKPKKET